MSNIKERIIKLSEFCPEKPIAFLNKTQPGLSSHCRRYGREAAAFEHARLKPIIEQLAELIERLDENYDNDYLIEDTLKKLEDGNG